MHHSKSLAGGTGRGGVMGREGGVIRGGIDVGEQMMAVSHLQLQNSSNSQSMTGKGRSGGLAMASISSHNLGINKSNDMNRRIAQSPYSFQAAKLASNTNVGLSTLSFTGC